MRADNVSGGRKRRRGRVALIVLAVLVLALVALLIDSNTRIVTTGYELYYPNLPEGFDGFRIVALSDIHAAEFGEGNVSLISLVEAANPDIIAITGDLIDGYDTPPTEEQLRIAGSLAAELTKIAPVYYITGNHDWNSGALRQLTPILEDCGVEVLRNRYVVLESGGGSIVLAGTDDPNGPADMIKPDEFVGRIRDEAGDSFIVMLEHRNNNLRLYSGLGVDLVLCGHAHGGIVRLPFTDGVYGPQRDWFPTYTDGVYTMGDTNMVASRGLGNHTGFPRFLNNPHIVVAVLRRS